MPISQVFLDSKNRAYMRAKLLLESDDSGKEGQGQYIVNNEDLARETSKKNIRVAKSNLVSIIPINVNDTNYVLNVPDNIPNQGNLNGILPMEKRLSIQDVFFTNALGFFLVALNIGGPTGYLPSHYQLSTFPSPSYSGLFGILDVSALLGIWSSGNLEIKVNGIIQTPQWWLYNHLMIPETMTNAGNFPTQNPYWDEQSASEDGYQIVEPNIILNGGNKNLYTVTYDNTWQQVLGGPNAGCSVQFAIAMVWDGWLAQNASSIMDAQPAKFGVKSK